MSGARGFLSERVNLPLFCPGVLRLKLRFYLVHLIQGGALIEICGTRRINLYPVGITRPYQGPSCIVARAKGLQGGWDQSIRRRLAAMCPNGHSSTLDRHIPLIGLQDSIRSYQFRTAPVGTTPVSK